MAKFSYRVKNAYGKTISGTLDAVDARSVSSILRDQGLFVIDIKTSIPLLMSSSITQRFRRIGLSEVTNFTRQLAVMISAGLTISDSLTAIRNQIRDNTQLEKLIADLQTAVEGGLSFSKALSRHADVFSHIYIEVVKAGEASGLLDKMLTRLADNLEKERELRGKVKTALIYPAIITSGMIVVMMIMMFFVVPQLTNLYTQLNVELPLPTKIVITVSQLLLNFWYLMAIVLVVGVFLFNSWRKTETGQFTLDAIVLRLPAWGKLQTNSNLSEMTRTFSLLVGSGTPIIDALTNVSGATQNVLFQEAIHRVAKKVEKGISLATALAQEKVFPPIVPQMARVGEETGKIDEVMMKISTYFEAEVERSVKALTAILEPVILVVLGIGVGFIMVAVILPIYNLTKAF